MGRYKPTLKHAGSIRWQDGETRTAILTASTVIAADVPEGKGPTGRAIYELRNVVCADIAVDPIMLPWRDKAMSHGFRSSASFPIRSGSVVVGALTVYSGTPQFFSDKSYTCFRPWLKISRMPRMR